MTSKRCPQCWQPRSYPQDFLGKRGKPINWCVVCQDRYRGFDAMTPEQKSQIPRRGVPALPDLRARLFRRSGNKKLGGIPASITSRGTCPTSCGFYKAGCYAEYHVLAVHWRRVGSSGDSWATFCESVYRLPHGQLWRHNEAGDLPGAGETIDRAALGQLVFANTGRRGFTFTHKPVLGDEHRANRHAVREAVRRGFTVNLSADDLEHADRLAALEIAPVAVVVPENAPVRGLRTPAGRRIVICPAQTTEGMTCASCELCAHPQRASIIGFRAHGQAHALVTERSRRHLPIAGDPHAALPR